MGENNIYMHSLKSNDHDNTQNILNIMKGILITAIVIGHNRLLIEKFPPIFHMLYFWHVAGFFYVSILSRSLTSRAPPEPKDLAVRYLIPFAIFLSICSVATLFATRDISILRSLFKALLFGYARYCEEASNISLFWFLPAFLSFSLSAQLYCKLFSVNLNSNLLPTIFSARVIATFTLGICFLTSILAPTSVLYAIPMGLSLSFYLLPMSLVFLLASRALNRGWAERISLITACSIIVIIEIITIYSKNMTNISVFQFSTPPTIALSALNAAASVSASILILIASTAFSRWLRVFRYLGSRSMHVYLFHIFIQTALVYVAKKISPSSNGYVVALESIAISALSISVSLAVSASLDRAPFVKSIVFPKDYKDLSSIFRNKSSTM